MSRNLSLSFGDRVKVAWSIVTNSYVGASRSRRSLETWTPKGGDADSDTLRDLPTLRERSRDLVRNDSLAAGAINTKVTNVVGTGLRLNSQIDVGALRISEDQAEAWQNQAEREFNAWACTPECDIERGLNFDELQALAFRSVLENGDSFVMLPFVERASNPYGLKVQLLEADRVSNPNWQMDTDRIMGGVEKDGNGAPIRYHITDKHPGRLFRTAGLNWQSADAFQSNGRRNVLHLFHKRRINQTRGVPDLAPVMEQLKQLSRYTQAEIDAAVVTAFLAIVTKTPQRTGLGPAALGGTPDTNTKTEPYQVGPALVLDLKDGEEIDTVDPSRPNGNFDPFVQAVLRQVGAAIELPFEILVKHFTSSYSAARAALEDAKRFYRGRRFWLSANLCQPVYEAFIWEAIASGRLSAPGFLNDPRIRRAYLGDYRDQWIGPGFAQIDPVKENQANEIAVKHGWKTHSEVTAEQTGGDWERKHRRRVKEETMRQEIPTNEPESAGNET